jgi:hypothetical protein
MSDVSEQEKREQDRLAKSLANRNNQKSAAEKKKEEAARVQKIDDRKKKEDEDKRKADEHRKEELRKKEEARVAEQKRSEAEPHKDHSASATSHQSASSAPSGGGGGGSGVDDYSYYKDRDVDPDEEEKRLRKEEERMAKMFGGNTFQSHQGELPKALAAQPKALVSPRGLVSPRSANQEPPSHLIGKYHLAASPGSTAETVHLDTSGTRNHWLVKVQPCKYNIELTVKARDRTFEFHLNFNGKTDLLNLDLPMVIRPEHVSMLEQDSTGITFKILY